MTGKVEVGETLREVFALYRAHAGVLLPIAFWLFLVVGVVEGIVGESAIGLLVLALSLVVLTLYQGVVVGLVRDVKTGKRDISMGELVSAAFPFVLPLAGAGILAVLGLAAGFLLLVVPGLFLFTKWVVIAPAIVIEKRGIRDAFRRSWDLVKGHGWPVFGAILSVYLLAAAVAVPLTLLAMEISGGPVLEIVFLTLAATVTAPIEGLVAAVLYYRLLELEPQPAAAGDFESPADELGPPPATA